MNNSLSAFHPEFVHDMQAGNSEFRLARRPESSKIQQEVTSMIGMGFGAFLTLFIISFIAAIVIHSGIHYRFLAGVDGFFAKWILGWLGAWVATPVLGHWFAGVAIGGQYIIPAFLGAFSAAFMIAAVCKMMAKTRTGFAEYPERVTAPSMATNEVAHGTRAA